MQLDMVKECADSMRKFSKDKFNIKLKAAHAHELVAAYLGYNSKNAMLADVKYLINSLDQAKVIVMTPDEFIDQRRKELEGFPSGLPDSYLLGESVYAPLFAKESWVSEYPPFRSFAKLAQFFVERDEVFRDTFQFYSDIPFQHIIELSEVENSILLTVVHTHSISTGELQAVGQTTIYLQRIAGRIGFGLPQVSTEKWTGGAKKIIKPVNK